MPRELKDLRVGFISLVDKGANNKAIIWKAKHDGKQDSHLLKTIEIKKRDEEQHTVYGIVYAPDEVDAHGDFATAQTIKQAAYNFMRDRNTDNVDVQHNLIKTDAFVAESWIVQPDAPLFGDNPGAWAVAIKVENEDIWQAIKDGIIGGISLYGQARTNKAKGLLKRLLKGFSENLEITDLTDRLWKLTSTLDRTIYEILSSDSFTQHDEINTAIDEFKTAIDGLKLTKAGAVLSQANLKALQNAITQLQNILTTANKTQEEKKQMPLTPEDLKSVAEVVATAVGGVLEKSQKKETAPEAAPEQPDRFEELSKQIKELSEKQATLEKELTASKAAAPDGHGNQPTAMGLL